MQQDLTGEIIEAIKKEQDKTPDGIKDNVPVDLDIVQFVNNNRSLKEIRDHLVSISFREISFIIEGMNIGLFEKVFSCRIVDTE